MTSGQRIGWMVTELDWDHQGLTGTIPVAMIGALYCLDFFNIYDNEVKGEIPPQIGALTNPITLLLSDNPFSGDVPFTLTNLTGLHVLSLMGTSLPRSPHN